MKNLPPSILAKRNQILEIAATYGARQVSIFGSAIRGEATAKSDVDILVDLAPGYSLLDIVALKQDLEDLLGCPVDLVTRTALSPYIRQQVLAEAVPL